MPRLWTRAIRPPDDITPNPNDPASVPPATVGPPDWNPGDPDGVDFPVSGPMQPLPPPPRVMPWSGWPAGWNTPNWAGQVQALTDVAWMCVDKNASVLSTMPPYLVGAAPSRNADWIQNPDDNIYTGWVEFAKQVWWDYQLGEAFVLATARYADGYPARFRVVPPWSVNVEMDAGRRRYLIGSDDITPDMLHIRYQSTVGDAHGHGPLEAGAGRLVAAQMLGEYATRLAQSGGIPAGVIHYPAEAGELTAEQSLKLKNDWVAARVSAIGEPAVLSGGITFEAQQVDPEKMALVDLSRFNDSRIATMLGVPPFVVGLPSGGDSMTYSNVTSLFDFWWRDGLRPKAEAVTEALSGWLLPRGTVVEVNSDQFVRPGPYERAQTYQILVGLGVMTIDEVRAAERLDDRVLPETITGVLA